jgi:3-phenylpropionate/trans-cinnamate dioxygenase ferredoxin subunit
MTTEAPLIVGSVSDFAPDSATTVVVDGHRLAVVRLGDGLDGFYIIGDRCSHANYSLAEGELDGDAKTLECWKHGSAFSLENGEPDTLPATKPVPTYDVSIVDDTVQAILREPSETTVGPFGRKEASS